MPDHVFQINPSRTYLLLLSVMLFASLVVVITLPMGWGYQSGLLAVLLVYGGRLIWQHGLLKGKQAIRGLSRQDNGSWMVQTSHGTDEMTLCGDSTVTHLVSVLRFKRANQYFPTVCTLFPDSLPADEYRQLTVILRHQSA